MTVTTEKAKVNKGKVIACLTCKLCQGIFREATTISECLHTLHGKPISLESFSDIKHNVLCILRADRALQDLTEKLLPGGEKDNATASDAVPSTPAAENVASVPQPETQPSVPEPTIRKERTLSSIAAKTRKLSSRASLSARRARAAGKRILDAQESPHSKAQTYKVAESNPIDEKKAALELVQQISTHLSERRAKAAARKKLLEQATASADEPANVEVENEKAGKRCVIEALEDNSETGNQQNNTEPALSYQNMPHQNPKDNAEVHKEKPDNLDSVNFLVGAASKTKPSTIIREGSSNTPLPKFNSKEKSIPPVPNFNMHEKSVSPAPTFSMKAVAVDSSDENPSVAKVNLELHNGETNANGRQNKLVPQEISPVKARKLRSTKQRKARMCQDLNLPPPPPPTPAPALALAPTMASSSSRTSERVASFWFSLVASQEQEIDAVLPQIPARFLRVNDASLPVSFIQRYLKIKLGLASEDEVEILLKGYQVLSSWQLQNLVELWHTTLTNHEKIHSYVGSSAEDFVMVLSYRRRLHI
ncbi:hypothetical protein L6164_012836 [Bauhinia variegata]|uniref:Uncharacterized protein n=1 Tax=Bauhinia variegata TaxID=167791 RepID=A0ACB9PBG0_BAUVA|nr:hypothetical protein L6164_012836 [Bauhinia variegata]